MRPLIFPYKIYKGTPCPIVPVELFGQRHTIRSEVYVDSGAFYSIFSINEAQGLDIDYAKGKKLYATVGNGGLIPIYLHRLKVKLGSASFPATIGFSPKLGVGFNLLGRKDFFSYFDITFSDKTQRIIFSPTFR
jgi:hypothetical protein